MMEKGGSIEPPFLFLYLLSVLLQVSSAFLSDPMLKSLLRPAFFVIMFQEAPKSARKAIVLHNSTGYAFNLYISKTFSKFVSLWLCPLRQKINNHDTNTE